MRPFVELPNFGIRQSGFGVQGYVPRQWHLVIPNFGSQPGQDLHLLIGRVITPAGKIHMTTGPGYVRACQQWLIGTLSLDSSKWMNKGGGETQQTDGGYTCPENDLH
jgi:hypothetical protein